MRYVFVCMGNTCRSPMAEAVMKMELLKRNARGVSAESCGIMAYEGAGANESAKQAVLKYGCNLDFHSARRINAHIVNGATVLCMEKPLTDYVKNAYPDAEVYDFCAYAGVSGGISDPYGMGQDVYDDCLEKIRGCIEKILDKAGWDR